MDETMIRRPHLVTNPDNPPLKPGTKFVPWRDVFLQRIARHKARVAERRYAIQVWEDEGGSVSNG